MIDNVQFYFIVKGLKVKGYWFFARARQLMKEYYPETASPDGTFIFKFSNRWFDAFKDRYKISLRAITNKAQESPIDKVERLRGLHHFTRYIFNRGDNKNEGLGAYTLDTIYNMDQTPIPFDYNNGKTYATTGSKSIQVKGTASGLEKRQATVQLCIRADGVNDIKPTIIFRGTGKRIKSSEANKYDKGVVVMWQTNAWADERVSLVSLNYLFRGMCAG